MAHGIPTDPTSPCGYMYSLDYDVNWSRSEIAISTGNAPNLPHGVMAALFGGVGFLDELYPSGPRIGQVIQ